MALVLDASAILSAALPDEDQAFSEAVIDALAETPGLVPSLFWYEIWNGVAVNITKRQRIGVEEAARFLAWLDAMKLDTAPPAVGGGIIALCVAHGLTAYDAAYLEVAKRFSCPLATQDGKLREACDKEGVSLFSGS